MKRSFPKALLAVAALALVTYPVWSAPASSSAPPMVVAAPAPAASTLAPTSAPACRVQKLWFCKDTPFETPYYVIDSLLPGPTVLVSGGVHGDEPAGAVFCGTDDRLSRCDCRGFARWHHCKHLDAANCLIAKA